MLTIDDLPTGYARASLPKSSQTASTDACPKGTDPFKRATLAKAEASFSRGTLGPFLIEGIAQQKAGIAAKGMANFRHLLAKCGTFKPKDKDGSVSVGHVSNGNHSPVSSPRR